MGQQSRLKKLRQQCRFAISRSEEVSKLDEESQKRFFKELYKRGKKALFNASEDIPQSKPKQGQSE